MSFKRIDNNYKIIDNTDRFTQEEYNQLLNLNPELSLNKDNIINNSSMFFHIYDGKSIYVTKVEDEYYYVENKTRSNSINTPRTSRDRRMTTIEKYKCDQMIGLIECLKSIKL